MKILQTTLALLAGAILAEAVAQQKPFFPVSPTSDEDTTTLSRRPQILPVQPQARPQAQQQQPSASSQGVFQDRPQIQPAVIPESQQRPEVFTADGPKSQQHRVEPRQLSIYSVQGEKASSSAKQETNNKANLADSSHSSGRYHLPGTNYGYSGSTGGIIACTSCSPLEYSYAQKCCTLGYSQCCNVGYNYNYPNQGYNQYSYNNYPQTNSQWTTSAWPYNTNIGIGGGGYNYNYQQSYYGGQGGGGQKPGICANRGGYTQYPNHNAGYYVTRRSSNDDGDENLIEKVKRDAPLTTSGSGGYSSYQPAGGYGYSGGNTGYTGGGYSGGGYSGGGYSGGGYSGGGYPGGGYSGGGYPGGGYSGGGYPGGGYSGGGGYSSGGFHGGNGIIPSSTYRPGFGSGGYCYRDYDCPGIQKCCGGYCSNPTAIVG